MFERQIDAERQNSCLTELFYIYVSTVREGEGGLYRGVKTVKVDSLRLIKSKL